MKASRYNGFRISSEKDEFGLRFQEGFSLPLKTYSESHFQPSTNKRLMLWYGCFEADPMRKLIGRNIDRECDRNDIGSDVWIEFLRRLSVRVLPEAEIRRKAEEIARTTKRPEGECREAAESEVGARLTLDPLTLIDLVLSEAKTYFLLAGLQLSPGSCDIAYHYMKLEDFQKFYLTNLPIPSMVDRGSNHAGLAKLAHWINAGIISGTCLAGRTFGKPGSPVWCTNQSLIPKCSATEIRNLLGLRGIDGGYILEVAYPTGVLPEFIRAPTVLDACASGAGNWIFVKNRNSSTTPDFGYTAKLTEGTEILQIGVPEAVHAPFKVDGPHVAEIMLRALTDPITKSPPGIDYQGTLDAGSC